MNAKIKLYIFYIIHCMLMLLFIGTIGYQIESFYTGGVIYSMGAFLGVLVLTFKKIELNAQEESDR